MTTRVVRTREDETRINNEYKALASQVKLVSHDIDCIRLVGKMSRIIADEKLLEKHMGAKAESTYRAKVFKGKRDLMPTIRFYLKNKNA